MSEKVLSVRVMTSALVSCTKAESSSDEIRTVASRSDRWSPFMAATGMADQTGCSSGDFASGNRFPTDLDKRELGSSSSKINYTILIILI